MKCPLKKALKTAEIFALGLLAFCFSLIYALSFGVKPAENAKAVIVLGAALEGEAPSPVLQCRLDAAYSFLKDHPDAIVVAAGGQGSDEMISEALAMKNYLTKKGIAAERIYLEETSVNTAENFKNAAEILKDLGFSMDDPLAYATNRFHVFRAGEYAKAAGLTNISALRAKTPVTALLPCYFREIFALFKWALLSFKN